MKKVHDLMQQNLESCEECAKGEACEACGIRNQVYQRFAETNIPIKYWSLSMDKFEGDPNLLKKYKEYIANLQDSYRNCRNLLLIGSHGNGKTMTATSILKNVAISSYSGLYITLNDLVNSLVKSQDTMQARQELLTVDFLVIDEFDPRHIGSPAGADLFGRVFEDIFRSRVQNELPTILCTNSPDVLEAFKGPILASIKSLMNYVETITVLGKDWRKDKR